MKKLKMYRHVLSFCLSCFFCFTSSMTVFSATVAIPSNADGIPENPTSAESKIPSVSDNGKPETSEANISVLVTAIHNENELASLPTFTLPLRTSPSDDNMEEIYLLALKYQTISAIVTADGESREEIFSVAWDFSPINQTVPGEYFAVGSIELPACYAFGENVLQELRIPVLVKEMPPAVITSVESWYPYTDAFAFLQGSKMETLEELFAFSPYYLECYAENGDSYTATVEWDFSGIDFSTVGLYYAKGTLSAPENTVFAEGLYLPEISIPISVQAPEKPDINCMLVARGSLRFPWVTPPGNLDEISVWLSEDNGSWVCLEDGVYVGPEMLSIDANLLTPGSSYRLQVDYDGGQTGILSFTYADEIILEGYHDGDRDGGDADGNPPNDMTQPAPETPRHTDDSENDPADNPPSQSLDPPVGDDDGASSDDSDEEHSAEHNPPAKPSTPSTDKEDSASDEKDTPSKQEHDNTTNVAKPDSNTNTNNEQESETTLKCSEGETNPDENSPTVPAESEDSKNAAFSEFFGETTDRISGIRFFMMLQTGNQRAVFSKQGITISIPKDALPDTIQEDDQIEVTIQKKQDGGFSFLFSINGTSLDCLPSVLVMMPYSPKPTADTLYLLDENDTEFPMTDYDDTAKAASFLIDHTGTYITAVKEDTSNSLKETVAPNGNRQQMVLFLLPVCLLLLPIGAILLRRRQK